MDDIILLKQGEIILKGLNRREFESRLIANIKRRLSPFGDFRVYAMQSAIYVEPQYKESAQDKASARSAGSSIDMDGALEAVSRVFGVQNVVRAAACEKDKDAIVRTAAEYLGDELRRASSFKVESKRSDKTFPMSSIEISQYAGGELHDLFAHLKADMHTPELIVNVEVRDLAAYVHGPALPGAGGLPVGTSGRMTALLSGGIDSPVALYLMAKRGAQIIPVHFYSHPYTSVQAREKVLELAGKLSPYCGNLKVILVPFTHVQEEISKNCPDGLGTIITRRFMMRIAEKIALRNGCKALVTGDNLGQVASQTTEALAVSEQCVRLPVFRPLLAFDKREITDYARKIGTYETSVLPYEDCCTVFTPRRPRTKPRLQEVLEAEAKLDAEALVTGCLEETANRCLHCRK